MAGGMPVAAQQFTTADEVRPILASTRGNWVAVREYNGKDLVYFTHLITWRCGLDGIYYAVNGGAETRLKAEPCHDGEPTPNAIKSEEFLPFISLPLKSLERIQVRIMYDDGKSDSVEFSRADVLMY
ncbi:MAG: hypothetical protein CR993_08020 [Rhodobacterales bacterium]|nr:MAG: hypothetical protein CR993_08020 [Rhodobacterales bacterium]